MLSVVLLIGMASDRPVHTISRFVCMGCKRPSGPCPRGEPEFQHLRSPAAIHVGMSPDCRKLGLGLLEISIAAGTGADVMAGGAVILSYHTIPVYVYIN